jgi:hypothetical protein
MPKTLTITRRATVLEDMGGAGAAWNITAPADLDDAPSADAAIGDSEPALTRYLDAYGFEPIELPEDAVIVGITIRGYLRGGFGIADVLLRGRVTSVVNGSRAAVSDPLDSDPGTLGGDFVPFEKSAVLAAWGMSGAHEAALGGDDVGVSVQVEISNPAVPELLELDAVELVLEVETSILVHDGELGNDTTGNGTPGHPYRTLGKLLTVHGPDMTGIQVLKGGDIFEPIAIPTGTTGLWLRQRAGRPLGRYLQRVRLTDNDATGWTDNGDGTHSYTLPGGVTVTGVCLDWDSNIDEYGHYGWQVAVGRLKSVSVGAFSNGVGFVAGEILGNHATQASATKTVRFVALVPGSPNKVIYTLVSGGALTDAETLFSYGAPQESAAVDSTPAAAAFADMAVVPKSWGQSGTTLKVRFPDGTGPEDWEVSYCPTGDGSFIVQGLLGSVLEDFAAGFCVDGASGGGHEGRGLLLGGDSADNVIYVTPLAGDGSVSGGICCCARHHTACGGTNAAISGNVISGGFMGGIAPTDAGATMMAWQGADPVSRNFQEDMTLASIPLRDVDQLPLLGCTAADGFTTSVTISHSDPPATFNAISYRRIRVLRPLGHAGGAFGADHSDLPADEDDPQSYGCRSEDCEIVGGGTITHASGSFAFERLKVHGVVATISGGAAAWYDPTAATGSKHLFAACSIVARAEASFGRVLSVGAGKSMILQNTTVGCANTGTADSSVLHAADNTARIKCNGGLIFYTRAAAGASRVGVRISGDPDPGSALAFTHTAFCNLDKPGSRTSHDTQLEWSNIFPTTVFSATNPVEDLTTGRLKTSHELYVRRLPASFTRKITRGVNGLPFSGTYGAFQVLGFMLVMAARRRGIAERSRGRP